MSVGNPTKVSDLGSVAGLGIDTFKVPQIKKNTQLDASARIKIVYNI